MIRLFAIDPCTLSARGAVDAAGRAVAQTELRADRARSQAHVAARSASVVLVSIRNESDAAGRRTAEPWAANTSGGSPHGIPEA